MADLGSKGQKVTSGQLWVDKALRNYNTKHNYSWSAERSAKMSSESQRCEGCFQFSAMRTLAS